MKKINKYSRLAGYLEKIYDRLNADFFEGALKRPVITIQNTPKAYGHYTVQEVWVVDGTELHEINIGAGTLNEPVEIIISTLVHEMCHQYNEEVLGVQDTSRNNVYHNENFKTAAENHGLTVKWIKGRGYSCTSASDRLLKWIDENDLNDILLYRKTIPQNIKMNKSNSRRYVCPVCDTKIRATKTVRVICGDCMIMMMER